MIGTGLAVASVGALIWRGIASHNQKMREIEEQIRLEKEKQRQFLDSWKNVGVNVWRTSSKMVQWRCPTCNALTNSRYSSLYSHVKCCNCKKKYFR